MLFMCFQLHHSLQQRAQKRAGQVLNMEEISTRLAGLRSTVIAMPGLQAYSIGPVSLLCITSVLYYALEFNFMEQTFVLTA